MLKYIDSGIVEIVGNRQYAHDLGFAQSVIAITIIGASESTAMHKTDAHGHSGQWKDGTLSAVYILVY